ncbi:MAG: DUF2341 domain-containing protein [Planctomycetes bacterium]|nr:DUF2341 domain-containing protein [Planctomycetota bacterium]
MVTGTPYGSFRADRQPRARRLLSLAAGLVALSLAPEARAGFAYRKPIRIHADLVAGTEDLPDFPVLISIASDDDLRTTTNGGDVRSAQGYDIIFRASDGRSTLDHEVETYVASTGQLIAWVRVPVLDFDDDTLIYIYYGNEDIGDPTENPTGVWDSDFKLVLHMDDATSSTVEDSTSSSITGTKGSANNPDQITGRIGSAQDFDAATERITLEDGSAFTWTPVDEERTLSLWLNMAVLPTDEADPFQFIVTSGASGNRYQWVLIQRESTVALLCVVCDNAWDPIGYFNCIWTPTLDTWHHIAMVAGSAERCQIYVDGHAMDVSESSWDDNTSIDPTTTAVKDAYGNSTGTGGIDELRLSHSARTAGWIETEYNNQSAPSSFYAIGSEEAAGLTEIRLSSFTARGDEDSVLVSWRTASEIGTLDYRIHRRRGRTGPFSALPHDPIDGLGFSATGRDYAWRDPDIVRGEVYFYLLEERDIWGGRSFHGPVGVDWDGDGIPDDEQGAAFIRGDLDGDGRLGLGDIVANLRCHAGLAPPPRCARILDIDDDGILDLSDAIFGLRYLFESGPPPPQPFPACGRDPTPDSLSCDSDLTGRCASR